MGRMTPLTRILALSTVLPAIQACHLPAKTSPDNMDPPGPTSVSVQAEFERVWTTVEELFRRRFGLDRSDERAGVIAGRAVGSQHFFEFWRDDVATKEDFVEASLNPLRRRAVATVSPAAQQGVVVVELQVHKDRWSTPERQLNHSAGAFRYFSDAVPTVQTGDWARADDSYWMDLGRDRALEEKLLAEILASLTTEGGTALAVADSFGSDAP